MRALLRNSAAQAGDCPPLSKGMSRDSYVKGSGQGDFQRREKDNKESQALEPEGNGMLSALMEGIQSDFQSLVKLAATLPCHTIEVPWMGFGIFLILQLSL